MIKKNYRLQLAKMLKLYKEYSTEEAMLIVESDKDALEVGDEVFVETEEGMTPAQDGEYNDTVNNKIYVVAGGSVTEIREKEVENTNEEGNQEGNQEGSTEENMEENGSQNGEDNGNNANNESNETGSTSEVEAEVEALKSENEALKAKVAELEATVSDLEDQVAAYKAKEEETEPSAEEAEKFSSMKPKTEIEKKLEAAKIILKAVK